jgi:hypothetical protein
VKRFVLRALGLLVVWTPITLLAVFMADLVLEPPISTVVAWVVGTFVSIRFWRYLRRLAKEVDEEQRAEERAAAESLRHEDPARYREIVDGARDKLALTDPDAHVGRVLAAEKPRKFRWTPPTQAQRAAVDMLTNQHGKATLVRTVDEDAAELVGVKDDVGYRYRIDALGTVTLISSDASRVKSLRITRRVALTGVAMFVGPFVPLMIWSRDGGMPTWLVPIMIVGFVLAFFGAAASTGPKIFLDEGESWQQHGSGWD